MCKTRNFLFSSCGHKCSTYKQCPNPHPCAIPKVKNITVDCCCGDTCCNKFIQPFKDAQQKAWADKQRLQAGLAMMGLAKPAMVVFGSKGTKGKEKVVENTYSTDTERETLALMAEEAKHTSCVIHRNNVVAEEDEADRQEAEREAQGT